MRLKSKSKLSRNTLAVMIAGFLVVGFAAVWWFASRAAQNPAADLNNDGQVNVFDLSMLLSKWGTTDAAADINDDNSVGILDLSILLSSWGAVTPAAYWTADWEEGPCTDKSCYSDWSFVQAEDSSQGVPSLNEVATAASLGIAAHSGTDVGKFQTTQAALDAGRPHSKVFKEWQLPNSTPVTDEFGRALQSIPSSGINGSYRAWYYIPSDYTYAGVEWTNIFQFKLSEEGPFVQDPQWWINIVGGSGNQPYLHVENWGNGTFTDPGGLKAAPKGRWFEIRADIYEGNKIEWYLDGQFWQTVNHSTHKIGRGGATGTPRTWIFGVGHYGGVGRLYTDDASFTPFSNHYLNFDFDTGNYSQFLSNAYGGFEVGDPNTSHQTQLVTTTRNGSGYANRYEVHNDPIDKASGTFRALWSKYDTNDGLPAHPEVYWGMSLLLPNEGGQTSLPIYEHLWELHQRQNIYQVPACAIAPHALMVRNNRLEYRMMTGACKWTGSAWNGYTAYHDQVPVLPSISLGTWYDVIVHIKFSENNEGLLEVWGRAAGQPWPAAPQVSIAAPTLPYIPGGLDPAFPTKASTTTPDSNGNTGLYLQTGLYTGGSTWNQSGPAQHIHTSDNLRRYSTFSEAKLGFPQ
jgi:hypothetical protein